MQRESLLCRGIRGRCGSLKQLGEPLSRSCGGMGPYFNAHIRGRGSMTWELLKTRRRPLKGRRSRSQRNLLIFVRSVHWQQLLDDKLVVVSIYLYEIGKSVCCSGLFHFTVGLGHQYFKGRSDRTEFETNTALNRRGRTQAILGIDISVPGR
jgi:hypothetical protein